MLTLLFSWLGLCACIRCGNDGRVKEYGVGSLEYLEVFDVLNFEEYLLNFHLAGLDFINASPASFGSTVFDVFQTHGLCHGVHFRQNSLVASLHRRNYAEPAAEERLRVEITSSWLRRG